ncbi:putative DNA-binding WGR domain protein [Virgibacillus natechei]|uniref:DNA-binding WGR domain protein n=1 Tax=Virgibacillus natechei TaxID=1216297 RepID=A0ABS4IGP8_9BACI|nr:putative DNA-binding WGR domain protein [Virgibacillus natechei]
MISNTVERRPTKRFSSKEDLDKLRKFVNAEKKKSGYNEERTISQIFFENAKKQGRHI